MKPTKLEVVAPLMEGLGICTACEAILAVAGVGSAPAEGTLREYPPEWQDDIRRLSEWVYSLAEDHGDGLHIRVIDPRSPEGLVKSLRHRVRHYPTWIVAGKTRVTGWDRTALETAIHAAAVKGLEGA